MRLTRREALSPVPELLDFHYKNGCFTDRRPLIYRIADSETVQFWTDTSPERQYRLHSEWGNDNRNRGQAGKLGPILLLGTFRLPTRFGQVHTRVRCRACRNTEA
jgi:hypothetical protein